jgi:hypothetical protein
LLSKINITMKLSVLAFSFAVFTLFSCSRATGQTKPISENADLIKKEEKVGTEWSLKSGVHMEFQKPFIELGTVKKGEKKSLSFSFTNTGTEAMEIDLISACECTTVKYPEHPIESGKSGVLDVVFDSKDKDKSETITLTIILKNTYPETGYPVVFECKYHFDLIK